MKIIYVSDNGYRGEYKDERLIVYDNENNEVARYYKKMCVSQVVREIEYFPEHLKTIHYQCRNCDWYYEGYCKMWHNEDGECKPVRPYQSSCRYLRR